MSPNTTVECNDVSHFAADGHVHQMVAVSEAEQAQIDQRLLDSATVAFGAHVTAFCPDCPGRHFHIERTDDAGQIITTGSFECGPAKNRPPFG
jgi:hypothetical protein